MTNPQVMGALRHAAKIQGGKAVSRSDRTTAAVTASFLENMDDAVSKMEAFSGGIKEFAKRSCPARPRVKGDITILFLNESPSRSNGLNKPPMCAILVIALPFSFCLLVKHTKSSHQFSARGHDTGSRDLF